MQELYACQYQGRPTFYLHSSVQGIVSTEHARRIAADVLGIDDPNDHSLSVEPV